MFTSWIYRRVVSFLQCSIVRTDIEHVTTSWFGVYVCVVAHIRVFICHHCLSVVCFRHPHARPLLSYNRLDEEYHVNRASHMGPYRVIHGLPMYVERCFSLYTGPSLSISQYAALHSSASPAVFPNMRVFTRVESRSISQYAGLPSSVGLVAVFPCMRVFTRVWVPQYFRVFGSSLECGSRSISLYAGLPSSVGPAVFPSMWVFTRMWVSQYFPVCGSSLEYGSRSISQYAGLPSSVGPAVFTSMRVFTRKWVPQYFPVDGLEYSSSVCCCTDFVCQYLIQPIQLSLHQRFENILSSGGAALC